jgi:PcfJ-like protein
VRASSDCQKIWNIGPVPNISMRSPRLPFLEWQPAAFKAANRFEFPFRKDMYRACAMSSRALQLIEVFPVLALRIYYMSCPYRNPSSPFAEEHRTIDARRKDASDLVESGARLRDVAAVMGVRMALRLVKPGAAHLVHDRHKTEWVLSYMPDSLPRMRLWLLAVSTAHSSGPDFAEWTAKHASQLPCRIEELAWFLDNTADWVRASHGSDGHQFVVQPFKPTMSLRTVTRLSAEWHKAVASNLTGPQHTFPTPLFPGATIDGLEIIPIDNGADLYREGALMHQCIGTYADKVRDGRYCVYSIRRNGESAGLLRQGGRAKLDQLRGPCNAPAPKEVTATVERWLRTQAPRRDGETMT